MKNKILFYKVAKFLGSDYDTIMFSLPGPAMLAPPCLRSLAGYSVFFHLLINLLT